VTGGQDCLLFLKRRKDGKKGLTQLEELCFFRSQFADAGLDRLRGLSTLRLLRLSWTNVTGEGVRRLQQALPDWKIECEPRPSGEPQSRAELKPTMCSAASSCKEGPTMKSRTLLHLLLAARLGCCDRAGGTEIAKEPLPQFEVVANLILPDKDHIPGNHAFRSAAIKPPWVYVLDREGRLYILQIPEKPEPIVDATTVVENVGDGNDLKIVDQALLCTRGGRLEVYSLKSPKDPRHVGQFGPADTKRSHSQSLVVDGKRAFLVGRDAIVAYDVSAPSEPKKLSVLRTGRSGWTGCVSGQYLYVGEINVEQGDREGIAVYDVADPRNIKEVGFTPMKKSIYHLFALPGNRLLASQDADSRIWFGTSVHGNSSLFSLTNATQPLLLREFAHSGGRTAALLLAENRHFLVCNGAVFAIGDQDLKKCTSFSSLGSTLDGMPYHGDSSGRYACLAMDTRAVVLRMRQGSKPAAAEILKP